MPTGNGTGPQGLGPMTGRGAGFCAGFSVPGYANPGAGCGRGFGRGGYGWRNMFRATGVRGYGCRLGGYGAGFAPSAQFATADPAMEKQALQNLEVSLKNEIDAVKARLQEIERTSVAGQ